MRMVLQFVWDAIRPSNLRIRWRAARANQYFAWVCGVMALFAIIAVIVAVVQNV